MIEIINDRKGTLIKVKTKPVITYNDMIQGVNYLLTNDNLPQNIRILEDARNSTITFLITDIDSLTEKMRDVSEKYISIQHAVIHNSPINTAYALLIADTKNNSKYQLQVFCTIESANSWLLT